MSEWNWDWHPNTLAMREAMNQLNAEVERYAKQVAQLDELRHEAEKQRDELLAALEEIGNTACGEASHQYMALSAIDAAMGEKK